MTTTNKTNRLLLFILIISFVILILFISHLMADLLVPVLIALFTAFFLHPFIERLQRFMRGSWLPTLIVVIIFILLISIFLTILAFSFINFVTDLPKLTQALQQKILQFANQLAQWELLREYINPQQLSGFLIDLIPINNIAQYLVSTMGKTVQIIKSFGLYALALIFILPGINKINYRVESAFPNDNGKMINSIICHIIEQIQDYMIVKSIMSLSVGTLSYFICILFKIEYALLWGFIIFLLNYIPIFGSIIAVMFPMALSLIQYQSIWSFALLTICLMIAQMVIGNIVEPRFLSRTAKLTPVIIFISLLIWGYIWGIPGVILAVPIMSAFNLICENFEQLRPISKLIRCEEKQKKIKMKKKS